MAKAKIGTANALVPPHHYRRRRLLGAIPQLPKPDLDSIEVEVEAIPSTEPVRRRIIHVLDWHLVSREKFAADIGSDDLAEHEAHMKVVEAVQKDIYEFLKGLEVKEVYIEGLTPQNQPKFEKRLQSLRQFLAVQKPVAGPVDQLLHEMKQYDILSLGSVGPLALENKVKLLPAEQHMPYVQANPVKGGRVVFDAKLNEQREDAVIRTLAKGYPIVYLVFGGAHDFRDNIAKLAPDTEYVRVKVRSYPMAPALRGVFSLGIH